MSICFAAALGHAPGITAWSDAAPVEQRANLQSGFATLRDDLAGADPEVLIVFTSEHWANFFLDHISAFCVGRAESYEGPIEPWLRIAKTRITGDPALALDILTHCYANDLEPGHAQEMAFDHGTMVPLHFLMPEMQFPIVPIMINTLAAPQPSARRCHTLGRLVGEVARGSDKRIALIATGGMSHDPGELKHGWIDADFDRKFLDQMERGDSAGLTAYSTADLLAAGAGALELLAWIALNGAMGNAAAKTLAYEPVKPWATGIGIMEYV